MQMKVMVFKLNYQQMNFRKDIDRLSQQIQINPLDVKSIQIRSQLFSAEGMLDQAIADCSKLIHLGLSRAFYVKRSQLLNKKRQYLGALKDLETAKKLQKEQEEQTAADVFLQNSICMKNIREVEQMALVIENEADQEKTKRYEQTIQQLLLVQEAKSKQLQSYQQQIAKLKQFYEQQTQQLKQVFTQQLAEIKIKLSHVYVNYESKVEKQLKNTNLSPQNQAKLLLYFRNFASEMEKYYIAAKNLHKIEDKTVKFQDFQNMILNKHSANYLTKIYKLFDKYSSQAQKLEQMIEHVPYIGTTFKIVKIAMKAKGWKEDINIENQCKNIEEIATNTTAFNEFSTNMAYYMLKHYERRIIEEHTIYKSNWELLAKQIKEMTEQQLGKLQYKHQLSLQQEIVRDYAIIHASILMVGFACKQIPFSPGSLTKVNKIYGADPKLALEELSHVFVVIDQVECLLKQKFQNQKAAKQQTSSSYCLIY